MRTTKARYLNNRTLYPADDDLLTRIDTAAGEVHRKLDEVDLDAVDVGPYVGGYLQNKQSYFTSAVHKQAFVLAHAVSPHDDVEDLIVLDHGGGPGLMTFLAKEAGVGTVIYNDIYDKACEDVERLGGILGCGPDLVIEGDFDDVLRAVKDRSLTCDALVSCDVLEHIYDIEYFLRHLGQLSDGPFTTAMATGANSLNPIYVRRLRKLHKKAEFECGHDACGGEEAPEYDPDSTEAFYDLRREIISEHASGLNPAVTELLAEKTRSQRDEDIKASVDRYLSERELPEPDHPTNTCDPFTGNWAERLLDPHELCTVLERNGFHRTDVLRAEYAAPFDTVPKEIAGRCVNFLIRALGTRGIHLSPFFTIYGEKNIAKRGNG